MRLWSVHPQYLDSKGLVALWREGLLAQKVLQGKTKGYTHHPQLVRFRNTVNPMGAIATYLRGVADEADSRGYHFNREKIAAKRLTTKMPVTSGQVEYEYQHLLNKLAVRAPEQHLRLKSIKTIETHPLFEVSGGDVEEWEIV